MPLWEHLDELRTRMIRCLVVILIVSCFTYNFSGQIVGYLEEPLLKVLPPADAHLYFTGVADKFFVYLKVSVIAAIALASPFLIYQIWMFVAPALYRNERRFVVPFVFLGAASFISGMAFGFYVVLPVGYKFLVNFGSPTERPIITLTEYFSLTIKLLLAMGLVFEVPVALMLLARFGVVSAAKLARFRRHAMFASAIGAAIITPTPDAFTMLLVMGPLYVLYEAGIVGVRLVERGEKKLAAKPHMEPGSQS